MGGDYIGPRPLPFSDFLSPRTHVFKIENGLESVGDVLKEKGIIKGNIPYINRALFKFTSDKDTTDDIRDIATLLIGLYRKDYEFYD